MLHNIISFLKLRTVICMIKRLAGFTIDLLLLNISLLKRTTEKYNMYNEEYQIVYLLKKIIF